MDPATGMDGDGLGHIEDAASCKHDGQAHGVARALSEGGVVRMHHACVTDKRGVRSGHGLHQAHRGGSTRQRTECTARMVGIGRRIKGVAMNWHLSQGESTGYVAMLMGARGCGDGWVGARAEIRHRRVMSGYASSRGHQHSPASTVRFTAIHRGRAGFSFCRSSTPKGLKADRKEAPSSASSATPRGEA